MTRAAAPALCVLTILDFSASVGAVAVAAIFYSVHKSEKVGVQIRHKEDGRCPVQLPMHSLKNRTTQVCSIIQAGVGTLVSC